MSLKPAEVLDAIGAWTIIELNEFVEAFCEKFNVSAAAPVAVAAAPGAAAAAEPVEEQTEFTVTLVTVPEDKTKKLKIVKDVKDLLNMGLREAKELVDNPPAELAKDISKADAENLKKKLEEQGATIAVK
jgi:large subunit ribosomal protein L7/L12